MGDSLSDQGSVIRGHKTTMDTPASVIKGGRRGTTKPPGFNKDTRPLVADVGINYAAVRTRASHDIGPTPSVVANGVKLPQKNAPAGKNLKANKRYPLKDVR